MPLPFTSRTRLVHPPANEPSFGNGDLVGVAVGGTGVLGAGCSGGRRHRAMALVGVAVGGTGALDFPVGVAVGGTGVLVLVGVAVGGTSTMPALHRPIILHGCQGDTLAILLPLASESCVSALAHLAVKV